MDRDNVIRRLRGAAGTAVVWGAGWAALGAAAFAALKLTGTLSDGASWLDGILIAARFGIIGGVVGGAFSAFVGLLYRGRRLSDLSAVRFGIGGGIMAGLFVPIFFQVMNLLSGDGLVPMGLVLDDSLWATAFGGLAAGLSLKLAQHPGPLLSGGGLDRPGLLAGGDPLARADGWNARRSNAPALRGPEA